MALQPNEMSSLLDLALALEQALTDNLLTLVAEVNAELYPDIPIVPPTTVDLGVQVEMLRRELAELPAVACGVYNRTALAEGEQAFTEVMLPYIIEVYLGDDNTRDLYVKSAKWAILLCAFVRRFVADNLIPGYTAEWTPDVEVSYVLQRRDSTYRQMIVATGNFIATE